MAIVEQTKAALQKHYGPLPGYAWIGIGAGAIYIIYRFRQAQAGDAATTGDEGTLPEAPTAGDTGATGDGTTVTQNPIRNVYYGIRRCPPGYRKVGHACKPKPCPRGTVRAGRRCVKRRAVRHAAVMSTGSPVRAPARRKRVITNRTRVH